jgi:predicted HTH domain antitoxin
MKQAPLLTGEELQLVKMGIILPVMLDVLQRDIKQMNQVKLKLSILYVMSLGNAQDSAHLELMELKAELRKRGIRIIEEVRAAEGIQAKFKCRGYDHRLLLRWEKVRTEILQKGSQYLGIILTDGG